MMSNFGFGFDPMFTFMSILVPIFFLVIAGFIITAIIRGTLQWGKNNASPISTVAAKVVNMRHEARGEHTRTWYYVTFEMESGERMELELTGEQYGLLALHDHGHLTFQGTRYKEFKRVPE